MNLHLLTVQPFFFFYMTVASYILFQGALGFPGGSGGKESACNAGDPGLIPGLGRYPGEGNGYPLQYSGLENSMECIGHRVSESDTTERLSLHLTSTLLLFFCLFPLKNTVISSSVFSLKWDLHAEGFQMFISSSRCSLD